MSAVRGLPRISSRIIRTERLIRALWLQRVFLRNHASGMMQLFNISRRAGKTQRRRRGAATRVAGEMRRHGAAASPAVCVPAAANRPTRTYPLRQLAWGFGNLSVTIPVGILGGRWGREIFPKPRYLHPLCLHLLCLFPASGRRSPPERKWTNYAYESDDSNRACDGPPPPQSARNIGSRGNGGRFDGSSSVRGPYGSGEHCFARCAGVWRAKQS